MIVKTEINKIIDKVFNGPEGSLKTLLCFRGEIRMKCYEHPEVEAIGICKHCQKGVCTDCSTDLGFGLACKDKHEKDVEFLNSLIENNKKAYRQSPKSAMAGNLFYLLMGILFIGFGYPDAKFLILFGVLCVGYWIFLMVYNSRYFKKIKTDYET